MFHSRWRSGSIILPNSGGLFAGAGSPCTPRYAGAPPCTRVTFPSRGKSPKARQGSTPGPPRGTERKVKHFSLPLPLRFPHPLDRVSATKIDRFATLGWWANRSFFLPKLHRGHTLSCQSVARQVGLAFACCPEWHPFLGEATLALLGG